MHSTLVFYLLFLAVTFHQTIAEGERKGRTRSLVTITKECNEIKEKLKNSSNSDKLQWEPSCLNEFTFNEPSEFGFGIDLNKPRKRGAPMYPPQNRISPPKPGDKTKPGDMVTLPQSYDAREVWGKVCPSFKSVINQGSCGNCWAVSTIAMINDRVCMHNYQANRTQKYFSAKHLTTCVTSGCTASWPDDAMDYWKTDGIPTGGDPAFQQPTGCQPYPTNSTEMTGAKCSHSCYDGISNSCKGKSFGGARYEIRSLNMWDIMYEIYFYGPVVATFSCFEDFAYYYKNGIYKRTSNKLMAGHAAEIMGWGVENNVPYWIAKNSWGPKWGEDGFFRIQRGTNEAGFEQTIFAGIPAEGLKEY